MSNKSNRYVVFCNPIIQSTVSRWVDPTVELRFLHFVTIPDSIYSMIGQGSCHHIRLLGRLELNLFGINKVLNLIPQGPTIVS